MNRKPNILFILSDQHNAKVLGHKDHPDVKTPNLDRMAEEGVRFDNAITQNPICTPSRVSWLSGQYCHNHGFYGLSGPNPGGLPTILGHFRRVGYRTAAIGKIHCPAHWVESDSDVFHDPLGCSIGGRSQEYENHLRELGLTEDLWALVEEFGPRAHVAAEGRAGKMPYEHGEEGWSTRKAISFMSECVQEGKPFFVHVSTAKPHSPYLPAKQFWDLYDESKLTLPPNAEYDMKDQAPHLLEAAQRYRDVDRMLFEPKTIEALRLRHLHGYLGNVSHVDYAVGELLNWLRENRLEEETIVIYSSDHGAYVCEHGNLEKSPGICHDAVTRIPFIWQWSGHFKAGHVAAELVEAVDLANTLCSLADIEPMETADGKDISHLLRGEAGEVRRIAAAEFAWSKSIRKGKYRYVYYPREMFPEEYPDGFGELYDLEKDPWEMKNLFFNPEYADIVRDMKDELTEWLVTTTRPRTIFPWLKYSSSQTIACYENAVNADGKIHHDHIRARKGKQKEYI